MKHVDLLNNVEFGFPSIKAKWLFRDSKEKASTNVEVLAVTQSLGAYPQKKLIAETGNNVMQALSGTENFKKVREGDYIISLRSFQGGIEHSNFSGGVSPAYTVLRPVINLENKFYKYYFKSHRFISRLNGSAIGIRDGKNIKYNDFAKLTIPNPAIDAQQKIADFLDEETAKIDNLIAKQERLLELLEEKRRATITHTVTRGLNSNVGLKDSGIEWLEEIPKHWSIKKIKQLCKINNGSDYKDIETENGYPVIGSGGVFAYAKNYIYDGESVLFGRKGTIDKPLYINDKFWTVDTMYWSIIKENTFGKFLYYAALTIPFEIYTTQTALPSMTQVHLKNHFLAVPSLVEQEEIANYLDQENVQFNKLSDKIREQLRLLKERRISLISNAVTGKIEV